MNTNKKNCSYFLAVITEVGKESVVTGNVKRPILKAKCYDSNGEIAEISIIFSSISQIRKAVAYEVGDILYFSAYIGECPEDNLAFYPRTVHLIKKSKLDEDEEISEGFVKSRLLPYMSESNQVLFEGIVCNTNGSTSSIMIKNPQLMRGECSEYSHIWTKHPPISVEKGDEVMFVGDVTSNGLFGQIYKTETN